MKKFTFKGVLDGFRQTVQPQAIRQEILEIPELLRSDQFTAKRTFRHGFPHSPTAFAFDPVQRLLAIGDKSGNLRILGSPGVDAHVKHEGESECAVIFATFIINEGSLITVTADDTLHLWTIRQKTPQVVQSLKFQRERVTSLHLPVSSKWLYVGTEKGNIHVVNVETFALSGYIINWNKAIEVVKSSHPGAVIAIRDNPLDANKLLIAFESGLIVLWDLRGKCAEIRWQAAESIKSIAWHCEGKYFVTSHTDGSISTWPLRPTPKPQSLVYPHAKLGKDGAVEKCKPIYKVDLKSTQMGETFTIFSGGMPTEKASKSNCITVMVGKSTTVLEMEHAVMDFITLCENPWPCETQEPYAIAVLLQYDLVLIDLLTPGFPCFESPYPMDLHESPVTCCTYLTDCPSDLVPAFYSVGRITTSKKSGFSEKEWPISGGDWSPASCSYSEIVITGHQDGSIKFWDSGAGTLQILYKLKTAKCFEKPKNVQTENGDNPLAIQLIYLCTDSRRLCVAGSVGQVILFKFRKVESTADAFVMEIPILYENFEEIYGTSPECDFIPHQVQKSESSDSDKMEYPLKVKIGAQRKPPGFQSQIICFTTGPNRRNVQIISLCINSSYGLLSYGTEYGLVIVDIVQKVCLLSVACPDLYGNHDPYSRTPKSPKRIENKDESRSPSSDQLNDTTSPDSPSIEFIPEANEEFSDNQQQSQPQQNTSNINNNISLSSRPTSPDGGQFDMCGINAGAKSPMRDDNNSGSVVAQTTATTSAPAKEMLQERRKSKSWKAFNLKRQLSKVNMKIGLNVNQNNDATEASAIINNNTNINKGTSTFYLQQKESSPDDSDLSPKDLGSSGLELFDVTDCSENDRKSKTYNLDENVTATTTSTTSGASTSRGQTPNTTPPAKTKDRDVQLDNSNMTQMPTSAAAAKRVDFATAQITEEDDVEEDSHNIVRPSDLPLGNTNTTAASTGSEGAPLKPQRQKLKEKRDQRLLSVPNIKYQMRDLRARTLKTEASSSSLGGGKKTHKLDGTFSRSRSSSISSIDMSSSESVTCLAFIESYAKKNDIYSIMPTLWIGTSFGSVLTLFIAMPEREVRKTQPVIITMNGGPITRLKGSVTSMTFLDAYANIIPSSFEAWRDDSRDKKERTPTKSSSRTSPTFTPTTANTILNTTGGGAGVGGAIGGAGGGGGSGSGTGGGVTRGGSVAGSGSIDMSGNTSGISGSVSTGLDALNERQYAVIISEKQAKVYDVANQSCINRIQLSEMEFAVKAETIAMKDGTCLASYLSNGRLTVHSLPSLKLLLDTEFLPLMELSFQTKCKQGIVDPMLSIWGQQIIVHEDTTQISKIFCFSHKGHGLYMASPTEIQKFTISLEFCQFISAMMGELYAYKEMPEQPKEGFFKGLFSGGTKNLDREELFGEQSGKANRSVARHIPGSNIEQLGNRASTAASEISRAHQLAMERGEKLNLLEERAERMSNTAENFSGTAHQLMNKYKDKKWYQL